MANLSSMFEHLSDQAREKLYKNMAEAIEGSLYSSFFGTAPTSTSTEKTSIGKDDILESIRKASEAMRNYNAASGDQLPVYHGPSVSQAFGVQVISSDLCVKYVNRVRGIPAGRKPNRYRPFYRKVRVKIPLVYLITNKNAIVAYPSIVEKIKKASQ